MVNVSLRVAYCLIVAWGIFNVCLNLIFALELTTADTTNIASNSSTAQDLASGKTGIRSGINEPLAATTYHDGIAGYDTIPGVSLPDTYRGEKSFTTLQTPTVTTGRTTHLDENTVAFYGTVNANGLDTTAWLEYGTSSGSYSNVSPTQNISGTVTQKVSFHVSGLPYKIADNNNYFYRIAAQNDTGASRGDETSIDIKTPIFSSSISLTDDATNITSYSAVLNGRCSAVPGFPWFEYDTVDEEYFYEVTADSSPPANYYATITDLLPATTYYYRVAGRDKDFIYYGETKSFTTLNASATPTPTPDLTPISTPAPCDEGIILETYKATDVTLDSATLNGLIGGNFSVRGILGFEYGTTSGLYPNRIGLEGSDSSNVFVEGGSKSYRVNGLSAGTTYYYRIYKYRIEIIPDFTPCYSYGNEEVFTTLTCEAKSVSVSPKKLILQRRENSEVTVTLQSDNCVPEGNTVIATIGKAGSRRISISSTSEVTDENGEARFTITAKDKVGKAKVTFKSGSVKKTIIVKVVRQ
ncbi:MAG TPA: fibronectin type III domain-containing protein [Candidatus Wunengus sp. YC63]|uniref:fibronectin type III domain-containing protein n=1 Tax=unclassified Candidatus Wunengus TaxID=3367695 RepID=UPI004026ED1F